MSAKRFTTHAIRRMSNTQIAAIAICSHKTGIEVKSENVINKDATK
ncbi:hypothetical protein COO91_02863 [Nostoc flagelliforme CCNUN1]|uniref:Uncharacterized protein n=1 Tax=Nostoc flagelliforme CCNUN1 TaxID=2038116 RepID=A0A2K8SN74_9NOSO|nr:hypothetical protein COO91_02863 [Nostoc flagelliforme CCNUN1]